MSQESPPIHRTGEQALEEAKVYVTKFGGTRAAELTENSDLIEERRSKGKKQILTISAIRSTNEKYNELTHQRVTDQEIEELGKAKTGFNVTSHLILIADCIQEGDFETASLVLSNIRKFTKEMAGEQVEKDSNIPEKEEAIESLNRVIDAELDKLLGHLITNNVGQVNSVGKDRLLKEDDGYFSITGLGEDLARAIYVQYLRLRNQQVAEVQGQDLSNTVFGDEPLDSSKKKHISKNVSYILRKIAILFNPFQLGKRKDNSHATLEQDPSKREQVLENITSEMRRQIGDLIEDNDVLVSGGYYPGVGSERGYSELTVALLAAATKEYNQSVVCLIEGDYPLRSGDPKKIQHTRLIKRMKYALAFELFGNRGSGADSPAVHAPALEVLAQNQIDTVVFNPTDLEQGTTLIQDYEDDGETGTVVVENKKINDALLIESSKMQGPGFLHEIGGWFKDHDISVVLPPSSEITMSLTFNNGGPTDAQIIEFETFLHNRYGENHISLTSIPEQSLVYCLGHNVQDSDTLVRAAFAFHKAGVKPNMNMGGYAKTGFVFSFNKDDAEKATQILHKVCIELADTPIEEIFQMAL
ncbi:hypothetical protein KKF55_01505 [Patescibacteria group bacterium]|nr:hypothetical protein [Patescibacteria group bacterium]